MVFNFDHVTLQLTSANEVDTIQRSVRQVQFYRWKKLRLGGKLVHQPRNASIQEFRPFGRVNSRTRTRLILDLSPTILATGSRSGTTRARMFFPALAKRSRARQWCSCHKDCPARRMAGYRLLDPARATANASTDLLFPPKSGRWLLQQHVRQAKITLRHQVNWSSRLLVRKTSQKHRKKDEERCVGEIQPIIRPILWYLTWNRASVQHLL